MNKDQPAINGHSTTIETAEVPNDVHLNGDTPKRNGSIGGSIGDPITMYLDQVCRIPLLEREDETELAKRIEHGRRARLSLVNGNGNGKQDNESLQATVEDGMAAFEHLILANSRLVVSIAKRYTGQGIPLHDLLQEGQIGLIRAAKKFDYKLGYKFSTYATWWIRQAITRAIGNHSRTIRVPIHMNAEIHKLVQAQASLYQSLGHEPSRQELAQALEMPFEKLILIERSSERLASLELPVGADEDGEFGDLVPDPEAESPERKAQAKELTQEIEDLLDTLGPRERRILEWRYGLHGERALTLIEIGEKLGLTRERIRQIELQTLSRLRRTARAIHLESYLHQS